MSRMHRGASATFAENTLESFAAAIDSGAQAVELDVRLSADGVAVVMHDPDVSRCTDGAGLVHELTVAELKQLDASRGTGERAAVPTLREVLDLCSGRIGVDLEIKNIPGEPAFDSPREAAVEALLPAGPELVERVHGAGMLVGTWVVDAPDTMARLFAMGVDAVATNDPALGVEV